MSSITYRQMDPSETGLVASLARDVFDEFIASHYQPDGILEFHRYASEEELSQRHQFGYVTLVAEHARELIGMLHLRRPCHVSMLFVQSSFQRQGVGRGLLSAAAELLRDTDSKFTVNSSPNAISAYEHLGFQVTGTEQCVRGIRSIPMQRRNPISRPDPLPNQSSLFRFR